MTGQQVGVVLVHGVSHDSDPAYALDAVRRVW
jgi:hypothetical protein